MENNIKRFGSFINENDNQYNTTKDFFGDSRRMIVDLEEEGFTVEETDFRKYSITTECNGIGVVSLYVTLGGDTYLGSFVLGQEPLMVPSLSNISSSRKQMAECAEYLRDMVSRCNMS